MHPPFFGGSESEPCSASPVKLESSVALVTRCYAVRLEVWVSALLARKVGSAGGWTCSRVTCTFVC